MNETPESPGAPEPVSSGAAFAPATSAPLTSDARVIPLASGRSLEVAEEREGDRIQVRSAEGRVLITIRLTAEGPVLSLAGASLEIGAAKELSLACQTLRIQAAQDASIEVGGSLHERVRGSVVREAGRSSRVSAREVKVEASPGGVQIRANDDVDIVGERVRLNSEDPPMPLTWEEHRARQALAATRKQLPAGSGDGEDPAEPSD